MPPTALSEAQYWSEVQLLPTEIEDAVVIFYTYEELNRLAVHDKTLLTSLNKDRLFWQTQMHCLQTLLFITLRSRKEGGGRSLFGSTPPPTHPSFACAPSRRNASIQMGMCRFYRR